MLFAAEEAVKTSTYSGFDPFVLLFTVIIAIGFIRLVFAPKKNHFAIVFTLIALVTFVFMDFVMISGW